MLTNRFIYRCNEIINFFVDNNYLTVLNNIYEHFHLDSDAQLFQNVFVEKQLLNLLVKLFFQHVIYADKEKNVLEYLKNNIDKLSPMTKLKFEQFLRSEELDC